MTTTREESLSKSLSKSLTYCKPDERVLNRLLKRLLRDICCFVSAVVSAVGITIIVFSIQESKIIILLLSTSVIMQFERICSWEI